MSVETYLWAMSLDPKMISCVIPTYNRPKLLEQSLLCIYTQQIPAGAEFSIEVIVVDDGSSAFEAKLNSEICESYKSLGLNLKYIKLEENSGTVSIPRNIGSSHISGRIIAPVDDDCLCAPFKFDSLYTALSDLHMRYTPLAYGNRAESSYQGGRIKLIKEVKCHDQDFAHWGIDNGQFIYTAMVYEDIDPVLAINACDWELYKQIYRNGGSFVHVDEVVCNYLWHGQNSSLTPKPSRVDPLSKLSSFIKYFKDNAYTDAVIKQLNKGI